MHRLRCGSLLDSGSTLSDGSSYYSTYISDHYSDHYTAVERCTLRRTVIVVAKGALVLIVK